MAVSPPPEGAPAVVPPVGASWGTFDPPMYGPVPLQENQLRRTFEIVVWALAAMRHLLILVLSLAFLPLYTPGAGVPPELVLMPVIGLAGAIIALVSAANGRSYELGRGGAALSFIGSIVPAVFLIGFGGMALSAFGFYLHTANEPLYRGMRSYRDYL